MQKACSEILPLLERQARNKIESPAIRRALLFSDFPNRGRPLAGWRRNGNGIDPGLSQNWLRIPSPIGRNVRKATCHTGPSSSLSWKKSLETGLNSPQHHLHYSLFQGQGQLARQVETVVVAYGANECYAENASNPEVNDG